MSRRRSEGARPLTTQNGGIALPFGVFALSFVTFGLSPAKKNDR